MRILRNIILLAFPLIIFINLYVFVNADYSNGTFTFRGFRFLYEYFSTFNGLTHTLDTFAEITDTVNSFVQSTTEVTDLVSFFVAFGEYFKLVFIVFKVPVMLVIDIVVDITWFLNMFMNW